MPRLAILVPTYNRRDRLLDGLDHLSRQISGLHGSVEVTVLVSDNASSDGTWESLQTFAQDSQGVTVRCMRQKENVGLERNVVALLQKATADWVMFLGDDDALPDGYLERVLELMADSDTTCIVPGFSSLYPDGSITPTRFVSSGSPGEVAYRPSWQSCARLASFGHQLSGVAFRREGTVEAYLAREEFRNLYPFVFFVGFNALRGLGWYLPRFQVLVLQEQEKDWSYDSSNLLRDVLSNFGALFPNDPWKRAGCDVYFIRTQSWRLGIGGRSVRRMSNGFAEIVSSARVSPPVRAGLPVIYALEIARMAVGKLKARFKRLLPGD